MGPTAYKSNHALMQKYMLPVMVRYKIYKVCEYQIIFKINYWSKLE